MTSFADGKNTFVNHIKEVTKFTIYIRNLNIFALLIFKTKKKYGIINDWLR